MNQENQEKLVVDRQSAAVVSVTPQGNLRDHGKHDALSRDFADPAAAFMPAVMRSLISEDSSSAMAAMIVNMARPVGLAVSIWP